MKNIVSAIKAGRSERNGFDRQTGFVVHAVPEMDGNGFWGDKALCGTQLGTRGYGWASSSEEINCPKCLKKQSTNKL